MNTLFLLLAMVPGIEARGSAIYFICSDQLWLVPLAVMFNFLAVAAFIRILEMGHVPDRIERFMQRRMNKVYGKVDQWFERYGNLAIFLLIALPSTGVGSFTGAFIGRAFGLRSKVFYLSILLGIALSLAISFPIAYALKWFSVTC